jgi:hypothetical protein
MAARTHQVIAIRDSADEGIIIGSGWLKQNGDIALKLEFWPLASWTSVVVRPLANAPAKE